MDFYGTWVYRYIFNAEWMIWSFVIIIFALNLLSPIFIWMIMSGRSVTKFIKRKLSGSGKKQKASTNES